MVQRERERGREKDEEASEKEWRKGLYWERSDLNNEDEMWQIGVTSCTEDGWSGVLLTGEWLAG